MSRGLSGDFNEREGGSASERRAHGRSPKKKDTRERILDVAFELIGRKGILGTTMRDVASKVGITEAAIYKHFSSKGDLIRAVIQERLRKILEDQLESIFLKLKEKRDLSVLRETLFSRDVLDTLSLPKLRSLLMESYAWGDEAVKRTLRENLRWVHERIAQLIKELQERGVMDPRISPNALSFLLIALRNAILFSYQLGEELEGSSSDDLVTEGDGAKRWTLIGGKDELWELLEKIIKP